MPSRSENEQQPLSIPSFLANPRRQNPPTPPEDEVDAVMESVREAAGMNQSSDTDAEAAGAGVEDATTEAQPAEGTPESEPQAEAEPEPAPLPDVPLKDDLKALATLERHIYAHRYAAAELETFGETIDPPKVTEDRGEALAILVEENHERLSDPAVGEMLERLSIRSDELKPRVAAQVRILKRDRAQVVGVSAADQAKLVRLTTRAYDAWLRAKANDDWRSFAPYLDKIVSLQRKIAKAKNPDAHPYDTLLDQYEPGTNRAFYNSFFARVKQCVVPLLSSISMSGRTLSRACVEGYFDPVRQWELAHDVADLMGIDHDAHYLTHTEHPFSEAMTSHYAVSAVHVVPDDVMSNVYSTIHEVGHSLYEQGVNPEFNRTSLSGGTSMGIHESQSRFFENCVGRDRAFIVPLLELLKQRFRGQLGRVTPNQLYLAVNQVSPSLIRTEADELTYPLHIIVRYEIEELLMSGEATAREVPKLWAERYQKYIGATVPNDTQGALQDVHWSQGLIGYFPSYALGNAYAAQLRAKMIDEGMEWDALLAAGDLAPIREWLRKRVWQYGRSKDPANIIKDACGEPFTPRHYANYLTHKFAPLYHLN